MKKKHEHIIESVRPGSIAEELGIEPGDVLLEIDGQVIEDIFDYQFPTISPKHIYDFLNHAEIFSFSPHVFLNTHNVHFVH